MSKSQFLQGAQISRPVRIKVETEVCLFVCFCLPPSEEGIGYPYNWGFAISSGVLVG